MAPRIGVLALQGDFREHRRMLELLGVCSVEIRTPGELARVDALVIPGGESTTIGRLAETNGLVAPIRRRVADGMPIFGTCAGMIFLAGATTGPDQVQLDALDVVVERNAFGRQVDSFEAWLDVAGLDEPMHAVFIRAPWISKVGAGVEVLSSVTDPATDESRPVVVRQERVLATSFHPELTSDTRLHAMFLDMVEDV